MIVPQFKRPEQAKSIDFTTIFIIERGKKSVFLWRSNLQRISLAFFSTVYGQSDVGKG